MCCLAYEETFYKLQSGLLPKVGDILERDSDEFIVSKVDIFNENFNIKDKNNIEKKLSIDDFVGFKVIGRVKPEPLIIEEIDEELEEYDDI